ncbi:MAG: Mur ligase family protein, partial [Saprospiraceae bacterium]|nr:Mur ligase family protein [Saprospiraceae bacterium]
MSLAIIMAYTFSHIARIVGGRLKECRDPETTIKHLAIDSRRIVSPQASVFFALPGKRRDGHDFIADAFAGGIRHFVVNRLPSSNHFAEASFVLVGDVLTALQALCTYHRRQFDLSVVGITGSNGKTIVKEWLFQLLRHRFAVVRSPKSYNSQIGVPLSVWQLEDQHEVALFEAGISRPAEMEKLAPLIDCRIGILTNIGDAHSEGFASKEQKLREKLRLFQRAEYLVYCKDDPLIERFAGKGPWKTFSWSEKGPATLQVDRIASEPLGTRIDVS